jgi:hypothetical protein
MLLSLIQERAGSNLAQRRNIFKAETFLVSVQKVVNFGGGSDCPDWKSSCFCHSLLANTTTKSIHSAFSNSGGWSPTGSTRHVGHQLGYCTCPGWLWGWRIWWNDDWQGKPKYSEKTCPAPLCPSQIPHDLTEREPGSPRWEASD